MKLKLEKNIKETLKSPKNILIKRSLPHKEYNSINITHDSNVAVFPELGIAFNRIKKSGNTTICLFLLDLTNKVAGYNVEVSKDNINSLRDLPLSEVKKFADYFSFVISRDPYARSLSAFVQQVGKRQQPRNQDIAGAGNDSPQGFLEFLRYLDSGGINYGNRHFWRQVDLLYQPKEMYSYVGKLENLVADMREILTLNNINSSCAEELCAPHEKEQQQQLKITSASKNLEVYYTEEAKSIVRRIYAADFATFGYDQSF